jgi:hypothetical protein
MASWGFLTNHARALLCIAHDPGTRRRATQAELKTPLTPGRQADGGGSALPDPGARKPRRRTSR